MTYTCEAYAYFGVWDFDIPAEEISELLGLQPTEIWIKGEKLESGRLRRRSAWKMYSALPRTENFQHLHLENLVERLLPKESEIKLIGERFKTGICGVGYYGEVNAGFHMSADLLQKYARLGLSIDFDLYTS